MSVPLWQDEPYAARDRLRGPLRADVCVVGGGIGGIATAWHLLERGLRPVLVEAREVAAGASGRNGGFFIAGAAPMYHDTIALWGRERARRIHAATLAAQAEMLEVAQRVGALDHFGRTGMLRLGIDAAEAADVRRHHAALAADGFPGELVEPPALPPALRRGDRLGLFFEGDGSVHPVRWVRALAAACEARGARIFERTRVLAPPNRGAVVRTKGGEVAAGRVVVAMDAGLAALVPAATAVRSRRLHMVATAPEATRRLPCPVYSRYGHEYAQQLPDGRVTLGGYSDLDGEKSWTDREEPSAAVLRRLEEHLRDELGVSAPVTHRWVGLVGYAEDPLPRCGFVPGTDGRVLALGGYNGTGHVQAWVAARIVADLVTSGATPDAGLYAPVDATARP